MSIDREIDRRDRLVVVAGRVLKSAEQSGVKSEVKSRWNKSSPCYPA